MSVKTQKRLAPDIAGRDFNTKTYFLRRSRDTIDSRRTVSTPGASHFLLEERSLGLDGLTRGQFVFWHEV